MPGTLEAYYQEAGRAGRDSRAARCILLHAYKDRFTHEWFIKSTYPERAEVERVHDKLSRAIRDGLVTGIGRDDGAAVRLLLQRHVLEESRGAARAHVRVLSTPQRIRRELSDLPDRAPLDVMRALWRRGAYAEFLGMDVDLNRLGIGASPRAARDTLAWLRDHQFIDFHFPDEGVRFTQPGAPLERFRIDWDALGRRKQSDMAKLQAMQSYAYTANCRRAFVLRYFGERAAADHCAGCDNCLSQSSTKRASGPRNRG